MKWTVRYGTRQNAKVAGNRFTSRFIEPGLISYEDHGGDKELLTKETLDTFTATFVGKPLIVRHNGKTTEGTITRVWWNPEDAWFWCEGDVQGTDGRQRINEGWSVSCGYHITDTDESGGEWHAMPYARRILAFEGEHLALVENPRYEGASIRLNEKSPKHGAQMNVFKLIKKMLPGAAAGDATNPDTGKPADVSGESEVEIDGANIRLNDLVELHRKAGKGEIAGDTMVEVAGKPVKFSDLVAGFRANEAKDEKAKKDEDDEKKKKDDERKNAADEDDKKKKDKEKEEADEKAKRDNAKIAGSNSFRVLANARNNPPPPVQTASTQFGTLSEQLERGKRLCSLSPTTAGKN